MNEVLTACLEALSTKSALRNDQAGVTIIEETLKTIKAMELELRREKSRADAHYENYTEMLKRVDLWARRCDCTMELLSQAKTFMVSVKWHQKLSELQEQMGIYGRLV